MGGQVVGRRQIVPWSCHCGPSIDGVGLHAAKPCPLENQSGRGSHRGTRLRNSRQTMQVFMLAQGPTFAPSEQARSHDGPATEGFHFITKEGVQCF